MMNIRLKKIYLGALVLVIFITSIIVLCANFEVAHAATETLQEKIIRYNNDDYLEGEPNLTISEFAENYKKGEYRPVGYTGGYPVTEIMSKVVPQELFYTAGAHAYMGKEYGFILYTYTNNNGISYFSQLFLIDFNIIFKKDNFDNPVVTQPIYRMETIFEAFLETSNDQGASNWKIYQPQSWIGTNIYLQNVYISANLENENEYNAYDLNYNKQTDGGNIITYATTDYCAHEFVGETNFKDITEWRVDVAITKGLGILEELDIPYLSKGAGIVNKAISFAKDAQGFVEAAGKIYNVEDEIHTTLSSETQIESRYLSKEEQKGDAAYDSYSREIYIAQTQMGNAAKAQFVPVSKMNDNGKFDNSFVELGLFIEADNSKGGSNSKVTFSVGFEAVFKQVTSANFVLRDDGSLEVVPVDMPGSIPVIFTHTAEHKIRNGKVEHIKNIADKNNDVVNDNIADDPAYLLDKNGYIIYSFTPQFNGNNAFGTYIFSTDIYLEMQPSTRIHLLKSVVNDTNIDLDEIITLSRDDLLNSPYLLAYNNTDYSNRWDLEYSFTDQGSEIKNTYYLLYTYSFDYLGGSSAFLARYEFVPTALSLNTISPAQNIPLNGFGYYRFEPAETKNYSFSIQGITHLEANVFQEDGTLIENSGLNSISALLEAGEKYIIVIKNLGSNCNIQLTVAAGDITQSIDYNYQIDYSLSADQKKYYQFTPMNLSGTYEVIGDHVENIQIDWYDANLSLIDENSATAFLTKSEVYYLSLRNKNANTPISGTVNIQYQNDVVVFYPELKIISEEYKQYFAYVVNSTNATNISKKISINVMQGGRVVEELCNNSAFNGDTFILDLTPYFFSEERYSFNGEICINDSEIIGLEPIEISNPLLQNDKTVETNLSTEYVHLQYTKTQDFTSKNITVPRKVKVLNIQSDYNYIRGLCFNIQYSDVPLILNIKNIDLYAPKLLPAINGNRDIILNCFGTVRLVGGHGVDDGVIRDSDGVPAIQLQDNLLIFNGTGNLTLWGGNGGNSSDGQEFFNVDPAGNGGTALEVYNLVVNINSLKIQGGKGGDGGRGIDGIDGQDGIGLQDNGVGARGTDGTDGGYGGDGGNGGMGVWILGTYCVIYTENLTISGGIAGNGGIGGDGGDGGDGAQGKSVSWFSGHCGGGRAGSGGSGGMGGDYGTGMVAFNTYDTNKVINMTTKDFSVMFNTWTPNGTPGAGGSGGKGGKGGPGGTAWFGKVAPAGPDGFDGIDGGSGGNPNPHVYTLNTSTTYNLSPSENNYNKLLNDYIIKHIGGDLAYLLYGIAA